MKMKMKIRWSLLFITLTLFSTVLLWTHTPFLSLSLIMDILSLFSVQTFSSLLLHDLLSLLVFSYLLSFQRYKSTYRIFEKSISWSLLQTLLLPLSHSKFPISLLSSSLPSLFLSLVFSFSSLTSFLLSLSTSLIFIFATTAFSTLVSTVFYTLLDTLSSLSFFCSPINFRIMVS